MQYTKESKIVAVADVKEFFSHLVDERQVAFHPDDRFKDYMSKDGRNTFSQEECVVYNRLMNESFEVCEKNGADIYGIGLELMRAAIA
jgi:hypothetical protein